jgi:nucleoside-diphosphate-sugar epimerase
LSNEDLQLIAGNNRDDWVYIDDIIGGLVCAAAAARSCHEYYIGHTNTTTFKELLLTLKALTKSNSNLVFGTYHENTHVDYTQLDTNSLGLETGFAAAADFNFQILKTIEWCRGNK